MLGEVKKAIKWVWSVPAIRLGFLGIAILEFFFQTSILLACQRSLTGGIWSQNLSMA